MTFLHTLDYLGTIVFAISGVLFAGRRNLDWFGGIVIAFVAAIGGGTLRDVLIGETPVNWIKDLTPIYLVVGGAIFGMLFSKVLKKLSTTLFLFDTLGIGAFTILGIQKCIDLDIDPIIAIIMGTVSAVFGGVIRDILCSETPLIFRKEIYATPCLLGGAIYILLQKQGVEEIMCASIGYTLIIGLRLAAVRFGWAFPKLS